MNKNYAGAYDDRKLINFFFDSTRLHDQLKIFEI